MTDQEKIYNLIKLIASKLIEKFTFDIKILSYRARVIRYYNATSLIECYRFLMSYNHTIILSIEHYDKDLYNVSTLCHSSQIIDRDIISMQYFEYALKHDKITKIMSGILYQTFIDYDLIYNTIKDIEKPL